jgi:hypothetical protein
MVTIGSALTPEATPTASAAARGPATERVSAVRAAPARIKSARPELVADMR